MRASLCPLLILLFASLAQAQQYKVGDQVAVIRKVALRVPDGDTAEVTPGIVLRVTAVNDKWLWVNNGKPGWIDSRDVLPLSQAAGHFSTLMRARPYDNSLRYARALVLQSQGQIDTALRDFDSLVLVNPRSVPYRIARGIALYEKGAADKAIEEFTRAIELAPEDARSYNNRGNLWEMQGDYAKALADYDKTLELDPKNSAAFNNRGNVRERRGEYAEALADYRRAIEIDQKYAVAYGNLAWLLATCPEEGFRDAAKAVSQATAACKLTDWKYANLIATLAAAHATAGDFPQAIAEQQKAIDMLSDEDQAEYRQWLELYQQGKPYRDSPVTASNSDTLDQS